MRVQHIDAASAEGGTSRASKAEAKRITLGNTQEARQVAQKMIQEKHKVT
jgi:hypothetical protein